jgi:hypothetical protein
MATMCHLAKEPRRSIFNFVFLAALGIELRDSHLLYQADSLPFVLLHHPFWGWVFFKIVSQAIELFAWGWLQMVILLTSDS